MRSQGLYQIVGGDQSMHGYDRIEGMSRLREAMRGIIKWTEEVVTGLYPLQWQVIG